MSENLERKEYIKSEAKSWILTIIIAFALAFLIRTFIFNTTRVEGSSMHPTLETGDKLISSRISMYFREPKVGDIIVFKSPISPGDDYIKRVIAKEGDEVRIENGNVYVNSQKIDEPYIEPGIETIAEGYESYWVISPDCYFVMGDNRQFNKSTDSRIFGEISHKDIKGIAVYRYAPFSKIGVLH